MRQIARFVRAMPATITLGGMTAAAMAVLVALALAGCTYTQVSYGDARLTSFRLWTDTSVAVETPEVRAGYSSDADGAQAAALTDRLLEAVIGPRLEVSE